MQKSFHLLGSLCACAIGLASLSSCGGSANGNSYAPNELNYFSLVTLTLNGATPAVGSPPVLEWLELTSLTMKPTSTTTATVYSANESRPSIPCNYAYTKKADNEASLQIYVGNGDISDPNTSHFAYTFILDNLEFQARNKAIANNIIITKANNVENQPPFQATATATLTCFSTADSNSN